MMTLLIIIHFSSVSESTENMKNFFQTFFLIWSDSFFRFSDIWVKSSFNFLNLIVFVLCLIINLLKAENQTHHCHSVGIIMGRLYLAYWKFNYSDYRQHSLPKSLRLLVETIFTSVSAESRENVGRTENRNKRNQNKESNIKKKAKWLKVAEAHRYRQAEIYCKTVFLKQKTELAWGSFCLSFKSFFSSNWRWGSPQFQLVTCGVVK